MKGFFDLSHLFDENTYHPFGFAHFRNMQMFPSHGCRHAIVTMSLHFGTHMDAPWHMVEKGKRLDAIAIEELVGEAIVVDLSAKYGPTNRDTGSMALVDLQQALSSHSLDLRRGDALLIYTGWKSLFQSDPQRYYREYRTMNIDMCQWLVNAGIRLFGIDAPDVDPPEEYAVVPFIPTNHHLLLEKEIYIIENVGGEVTELLNERVLLIPAPMKLGGEYASGAPLRLLATRPSRL